LNRFSLKTQFILTTLLILCLSLVASLLTYAAGAFLFYRFSGSRIFPANYYEGKVPEIVRYLQQQGTAVLDPAERSRLEQVIPPQGIQYQVLDASGKIVYGTDPRTKISGPADLVSKLNTTLHVDRRFTFVAPLSAADGSLGGAVTLTYQITPTFPALGDRLGFTLIFGIILLSPFIYIGLFLLLLGQRFAARINGPLTILTNAAQKIRENDLDFEIEDQGPNELGRLCEAFNTMKGALQTSLVSQWRMEQERVEMVEALAHDLKTPLTIILGYTESLLDTESAAGDPQLQHDLSVILENTRKGAKMVEQIRYANDFEQVDFPIEKTPVDVPAFLARKVENYQRLAGKKNVSVEFNLRDERSGNEPCRTDPEKLERILDNLVFNALRYTPENTRLTLTGRLSGGRLEMWIADCGPGFSKKDLANLFTRFYRGDTARSIEDGHSGLGLYIARELVEKMGGSIRAENAETGGARVLFHLPLE
jgi:signal transduction histidine kinase